MWLVEDKNGLVFFCQGNPNGDENSWDFQSSFVVLSRSVVPTLWPLGLEPARLLCLPMWFSHSSSNNSTSQDFLCLSEKRKLKLREVKCLTQSYTGKPGHGPPIAWHSGRHFLHYSIVESWIGIFSQDWHLLSGLASEITFSQQIHNLSSLPQSRCWVSGGKEIGRKWVIQSGKELKRFYHLSV